MRNGLALGVLLMLVGACGCSGPKATTLNYSVLRLADAPEEAVFDAAAQAMREHFDVLRADRARGVIESAPIEAVGSARSGRLGDVVAMPRRERRVAEIRLEPLGSSVKVFCRVLVQEHNTQAMQMHRSEHRLDDLPTDTPADRDGATTTEQNSVWRTRRHDRDLETRILRAIREQLAGATVM